MTHRHSTLDHLIFAGILLAAAMVGWAFPIL